jgi:PAS domain S-box-containing protein
MTLKAKSIIISILIIGLVGISYRLFVEYNRLSDSIIEKHFFMEEVLGAEGKVYRLLSTEKANISEAKAVVDAIVAELKRIKVEELTGSEINHIISVRMSFISIKNFLKKISLDEHIDPALLKEINGEFSKIEKAAKNFVDSFKSRTELDMLLKRKIQIAIFVTTIAGSLMLFYCFYKSFLEPVNHLTSQIALVKDGLASNVEVFKGDDEVARLSDFTHRTLQELYNSSDAISRRLEMQSAISSILREAQRIEDIDSFLKSVLDIAFSISWLKIKNKGAIFLIDDKRPDILILSAERNFEQQLIKSCSEVPLGRCICGRAAISGEIVYEPVVGDNHDIVYEGMQPHGHYCVPIKHGGRVMGVITTYLDEGYIPASEDRGFLENIAIIVADSISMKKLLESEHLITKAIEASGEGLIIGGKGGRIEYANPAFEVMSGYSSNELAGRDMIPEVLPPEIALKAGRDVFAGKIWAGAVKTKRKDGREYYNQTSIIPINDGKGNIVRFVCISKDVTKERHLEDQLRQSQKMETIGRLAGGVAHDFNNILTAIMGYASVISDSIKDDIILKQYAQQVVAASERAAALTRSLLAFSRKQVLNPSPVDINDIIRRVEKLLIRLIGEDIELKTLLSKEKLVCLADSVQIEQIMMNLVTNARDAMPNGGVITIETNAAVINEEYVAFHFFAKAGNYACISVSDTGQGMDEDTKKNIFEPFYTTKEVGKGTGLGLAIVYGIVKQHNGYINVYSEVGKGTTFKIYLPLIEAEVDGVAVNLKSAPKRGVETVLLAEDDRDVRDMIKTIMQNAGYTVIEAVDGDEAVRMFQAYKDRIDMIVFDIVMPKLNGKEAYDEIKKIKPQIKTLFMSGYTAEIIHQKGILDMGLNFISKPVLPDDLLRKVREVLDS